MTDTCPALPTILAWLENDLADEEAERLHAHVPNCEECQQRLALMDAVDLAVKAET